MGLQREGPPDPMDGGGFHAHHLGHRTYAPMGRIGGRRFQSAHDYPFNLLVAYPPGRSGPRFIEQTIEPSLHKPPPPFAHHLLRYMQALRYRRVTQTLGTAATSVAPDASIV